MWDKIRRIVLFDALGLNRLLRWDCVGRSRIDHVYHKKYLVKVLCAAKTKIILIV